MQKTSTVNIILEIQDENTTTSDWTTTRAPISPRSDPQLIKTVAILAAIVTV